MPLGALPFAPPTNRGGSRAALAAALGLLLCLPAAEARPQGRRIPVLMAQYWYTGQATLSGESPREDLALETHTLRARGLIGTRLSRTSTTVAALLQYDVTWLRTRLADAPWTRRTLHAPSLNLGVVQALGPSWGLMGYVMGGLGSDMERVESRDLRITVGAGASWRRSERLSFVFGAMYTTAMFIPLPLPMFHMRYLREPWLLNIRIPNSAEIWWRAGPWELGGRFAVLNLRYGLHDEGRPADELNAINVTAGPVLRRALYGGLYAEITGGYNARFFRIGEGDRSTYEELRLAGAFFNAGLGFRIEVPPGGR